MTIRIRFNRAVLLAASAALPFAAGCGTGIPLPPSSDAALAPPMQGPAAGNNARTAILVTEGDENRPAVTMTKARANIQKGPGFINYTIASDTIHDMSATGVEPVFSNGTGTAIVSALPDFDGNGVEDTFLVVTKNNPVSPARTEYSAAYSGPLTPASEVQTLRTNSHKATYTGGGAITGTVAGISVDQGGSMTMSADFGAATISGQINLMPNAVPTGHTYDNVTFSGRLTEDLNEFAVENATLRNGTTALTNDLGVGSGAFMGKDARGTVGTFAKSSGIIGSSDNANILGTFFGSTN